MGSGEKGGRGSTMLPNTAPNFPNIPIKIKNPDAHHPALRLAHPVNEMTPLFPACETIGSPVPKAEIKLPNPSHKIPPWIRLLNCVPSISTFEISAVARMSGMQLTASQINMISKGKMRAPSTESLKVWTQRKVTTGAASIFSRDQYPVAPDIAQPTARPRMMDADFISGEPNCSTTITVTKTLKPRPMSFGSPLTHALVRLYDGKYSHLPRERFRSSNIRAESIESIPTITVRTPAPILHPRIDQVNSHKKQQAPRYNLREYLIQGLRRYHAHCDLNPDRAKHTPQYRAPGIGTRKLRSICCRRASAVRISHGSIVECNGKDVKCWPDD